MKALTSHAHEGLYFMYNTSVRNSFSFCQLEQTAVVPVA